MDATTKINIAVLIVNSIAALFAVIAAIIAIVVYRKSAKQQERAINYSLLENRIQLWKYFEYDKNQVDAVIKRALEGRDWKLEQFRLLFSEKLVREYDSIVEEGNALGKLSSQIDTIERESFHVHVDKNDNVDIDSFNAYANIKHSRTSVTDKGATESDLEDFKRLCEQSFEGKDSNDYYSKVKLYSERHTALLKRNKEFIRKMKEEIASSVN